MRFQVISLHQAFRQVTTPFSMRLLTEVDEYSCFLFRCEGEMPQHRHLEHDELFWPRDLGIQLVDKLGRHEIRAGHLALVSRGWRHGSASPGGAHVLLFSRGSRSLSTNGHLDDVEVLSPRLVDPTRALSGESPNTAIPLLRCDTLQVYGERIIGSSPARPALGDVLVAPVSGTVGLRCGGMVVNVGERELARVPSGSGWHLFGDALVVWMARA
jgi:homogentisate 1,2-dioxygenase